MAAFENHGFRALVNSSNLATKYCCDRFITMHSPVHNLPQENKTNRFAIDKNTFQNHDCVSNLEDPNPKYNSYNRFIFPMT